MIVTFFGGFEKGVVIVFFILLVMGKYDEFRIDLC